MDETSRLLGQMDETNDEADSHDTQKGCVYESRY